VASSEDSDDSMGPSTAARAYRRSIERARLGGSDDSEEVSSEEVDSSDSSEEWSSGEGDGDEDDGSGGDDDGKGGGGGDDESGDGEGNGNDDGEGDSKGDNYYDSGDGKSTHCILALIEYRIDLLLFLLTNRIGLLFLME
jgi:hypothetical protein